VSDDSTCPNCGSPLLRRYCPDCGQAAPRPDDYSIRAHAADFLDQIASVDSKIGRTVWALVARPGVLTQDHIAGRRARYLRPLQLFLVVNVLLFLAAPRMPLFNYSLGNYLTHAPPSPTLVRALVQGKTSGSTADRARTTTSVVPLPATETYDAAFDKRVETQRKSLIILFAPALALALWILFRRRLDVKGVPRTYGQHLVFALHILAFVWLVFAGWGLISAVFAGETVGPIVAIGLAVLLLALPVYLFLAARRVYALSRLLAMALMLALIGAFMALLFAYRSLLFFTTYYTL